MRTEAPRLVHRDGEFNVVAYDGKYYRVPVRLGHVAVDAMTPEQAANVSSFRNMQDAVDGLMSHDLRGALLIRVNHARKTTGKPKISRTLATAKIRGASFNSEDAIVHFLSNLEG